MVLKTIYLVVLAFCFAVAAGFSKFAQARFVFAFILGYMSSVSLGKRQPTKEYSWYMEYINLVTLWGTIGGSLNFALFDASYIKIVIIIFFVEEILRMFGCLLIGML